MKEQPIAQRFAPAQPSDPGHWTALSENDVWMCDLVDMSRYSSASQKAKAITSATKCSKQILNKQKVLNKKIKNLIKKNIEK